MSDARHSAATPFFIVGYPRSGTTLLAAMLDAHSAVRVTPETRYCFGVLPNVGPDRPENDREAITDRIFGFWRIADLGVSRPQFETLFADFDPSYGGGLACLLECYRREHGARIVGEKSPVHLLYVDTLLAWFPDTRIICIVRDGRDCVASMLAAPFAHDNALRHAGEWAYQARLARRLADRCGAGFTAVRYEDLVTDPRAVLGRVMAVLGLDPEDGQFEPAPGSAVVPSWEASWKSSSLGPVDASRVEAWSRRRVRPFRDALIAGIMSDELDLWGYARDPRLLPGTVTRLAAAGAAKPFRGRAYRLARRMSRAVRVTLLRLGLRKHL